MAIMAMIMRIDTIPFARIRFDIILQCMHDNCHNRFELLVSLQILDCGTSIDPGTGGRGRGKTPAIFDAPSLSSLLSPSPLSPLSSLQNSRSLYIPLSSPFSTLNAIATS
jgi:hypothetical protein